MTSTDWTEEDEMLAVFERQAKFSLRKIKRKRSLNGEFRDYFLQISIARLKTSFDQVQIEPEERKNHDHSEHVKSEEHSSGSKDIVEIIGDSGDEEENNRSHVNEPQSVKKEGNSNSNVQTQPERREDNGSTVEVEQKRRFSIYWSDHLELADLTIGESINSNKANDINDAIEILDSDDETDTAPSVKTEQQQISISHGAVIDIGTEPIESNASENENTENGNQSKDGDIVKDEIDNAPKQEVTHEMVQLKAFRLIGVPSNGRAGTNEMENVAVAGPSARLRQRKKTKSSNDVSKPRSKIENPLKCKQCQYTSRSRSDLIRHNRKHTGNKPYRCEQCFKRFTERCSLKRHMFLHKNDLPFQCQLCFFGFTQEDENRAHENVCRFRRYDCFICGKCFGGNVDNLKYHMRVKHTGERPFQCRQCTLSFALSSILKVHMRTHTGERSFQCRRCTQSFAISSHLNRHMRTHTGEKPFCCEICKKRFTEKGNLKRHLATVHNRKNF